MLDVFFKVNKIIIYIMKNCFFGKFNNILILLDVAIGPFALCVSTDDWNVNVLYVC